jgi:hypothetical protein
MKLFLLVFVVSFFAVAEESEFREKMQEDMDGYVSSYKNNCGIDVKMHWKGGKFGTNPRETNVSILCRSGLHAIEQACAENKIVKSKLSKIKNIHCNKGKGNLSYKIDGETLNIFLDNDAKITQDNNPASQTSILNKKIITDLDT